MMQIKAEEFARLQTRAATEKFIVQPETTNDELIVRYSRVSQCFVYPETMSEKRARIAEEDKCMDYITIHTTTGIDVKVQIKQELKRNLIFGIQSRPAIGMIFSFFGFSHEVLELMQTLSHSTRAFIFNAERLNGFLVKLDICQILHDAYESGELEQAEKH
jgi:hypothetical protein